MTVPIKFPSEASVIAEEAARFRAMSPAQRLRTIRSILAAGALMLRRSPKAAFLRDYTVEQETRAQQAVRAFLARHVR